jgi:chitin-binding protein
MLLVAAICATPLPVSLVAEVSGIQSDPGRPTGLEAVVRGPDEVQLFWDEGKGGSDTEFYFVYRDGQAIAVVDDAKNEGWIDRGLEPWTEYTWHVVAYDSRWRHSDPSDPVSARTEDATPPGSPEALTASTPDAFTVQLSWQPAKDPESGIARYEVFRADKMKGETQDLSWQDESVKPEKEYTYRVRAVNGFGLAGEKTEAIVVATPSPPDTTPPAAPVGLRVIVP